MQRNTRKITHSLLSLRVCFNFTEMFILFPNLAVSLCLSFYICIYMNIYVCCRYVLMYIPLCMYIYMYVCMFLEQRRCIRARSDRATSTRSPLDFLKMFMSKGTILVWIFPMWWETCHIFHILLSMVISFDDAFMMSISEPKL